MNEKGEGSSVSSVLKDQKHRRSHTKQNTPENASYSKNVTKKLYLATQQAEDKFPTASPGFPVNPL